MPNQRDEDGKRKKIIVVCEFSGIVRDAFLAKGYDAVSLDIIPSERPGPHIVSDALEYLDKHAPEYDLMIAHPPCTYLANSGVRWLYGGKGTVRDESRWKLMEESALFFRRLLEQPIPRISVENPFMHKYAKEIITNNLDRDVRVQTIQPWQFGHGETKGTQFWLYNLPELKPTNIVDGRTPRVHFESPGPDRWKERSRTYAGIAEAIADQWGA